jgi:hypothetical protein
MDVYSCVALADGKRRSKELETPWLHSITRLCSIKKVVLSLEEKLQQYHDYMLVLLNEVKEVSETKPMMWVNLGGIWKKKRMCIVLSVMSGDQK